MIRQSLFAIVIGLCAVSLVAAQPGPGPRGMRPMGARHDAMVKKLNLTETQQSQMENLHIEMMKKQTQLRSKIQTLRLDIKQQFLADKVDRSAIEKDVKAISDVQEQMKMNMVDHWFAVNNILTPEQQKTWKKEASDFASHPGMSMRNQRGNRQGMMRGEGFRGGWDDDN